MGLTDPLGAAMHVSRVPALGAASSARRVGRAGWGARPRASDHNIPKNRHSGKLAKMKITWRDGSQAGKLGNALQRPLEKGPRESVEQAKAAEVHLRRIDGMLRKRWNRAGWNDRGGDLTVVVNQKALGGNAYFSLGVNGKAEMGIGTKDPRIGFRRSPAHSPSILFHELVHGIVGTAVERADRKLWPYLLQRDHRAVNESVADVISTGMLGTKWANGQEIRGGTPLRDLEDPSIPKWTSAVRRDTGLGEHSLSGILSRAAVLAADKAGTLSVVDAWYAAIDRYYVRELARASEPGAGRAIGAWVRATMRGAEQVGGANSELVRSVRKAWKKVGLGAYATEEQLKQRRPPRSPR